MKDWLDNLKSGLLITSIKGEIRQPHNYAMDRVPANFSRWQTASQYFIDIERILREMKSSVSYVSIMPDDAFLEAHSVTPEDYVMYHQGYFLDLVHQLKDKLCQLISAVMTPDDNYSKNNERSAQKIKKIISHKYVERVPKLVEYLQEWDDTAGKGAIAIALKKRTSYHHFKNPLSATEEYMRAKTSRFLLSQSNKIPLSELGRQTITERGSQSFQSWQADTSTKMSCTLTEIEKSAQKISKTIVLYLKFKTKDSKMGVRVLRQYVKLYELLEVKRSPYTITSVSPAFIELIPILKGLIDAGLQNNFIAFYVVGSVARGGFRDGISDINIVIITKDGIAESEESLLYIIETPLRALGIPSDIRILSEQKFLHLSNEKIRFVCQTDGFLASGCDLLSNEKERRKSFKLAWLLNSDFKENISLVKMQLLDTTQDLSDRELELLARNVAKCAYRLEFSMVIGNNTRYASDFREMRELMNFYYPQNRKFNEVLFKMITDRFRIERNGLLGIIDSIEEKLFPLYDKMNDVVNGVAEDD